MAITSTTQTRRLNVTTVAVVSDLVGAVFYHWYIDGAFVATTSTPVKQFFLDIGERVRIEVIDTLDAAFDPIANAPLGFPARRSILWVRSVDLETVEYLIEQQREAEGYIEIQRARQDATTWVFDVLSPRLDDMASYTWRVTPVDAAGNLGTAIVIGPVAVLRTPDAPAFSIAFDPGTTKVAFAAA